MGVGIDAHHDGDRRGDMSSASTRAATRWVTRIIPVVLAGCVGFATYVVIKRICGMFPSIRCAVRSLLLTRCLSQWTISSILEAGHQLL